MAEQDVAKDEEEVLVMVDVVTNDDGACSVMLGGWEAMPSNGSVGKK